MQKSVSLTKLYETASLLYVPSKSYIFQPQQYKNLLQQAYNLSLNEETGKMNLAIRVKLNQNWREQDKKKGETELVIRGTFISTIVFELLAPWRKTRNGLHSAQDMPSQKQAHYGQLKLPSCCFAP